MPALDLSVDLGLGQEWWLERTFALEQEKVHVVAEGGAEVGAILHQVAGQALPVEVAHGAGAAGGKAAEVNSAGRTLTPRSRPSPLPGVASWLSSLRPSSSGAPDPHRWGLVPAPDCWDARAHLPWLTDPPPGGALSTPALRSGLLGHLCVYQAPGTSLTQGLCSVWCYHLVLHTHGETLHLTQRT